MIHDDHPFKDLPEDRDPVRQFRGHLAAPVTVVTAGPAGSEAALTVSSLMVAEGEPSSVIVLIGTSTDLWEAIESSRRFVVHILASSHRDDADAFAGIRPRPGGVFAGVAVEHSDWGPVLTDATNRIFCNLASS
ncbi:MAG: flavin reductase, partial [Acidimicrobiia bacterium]|nr:flavin reductase [Acidimicrobiia bacterium]